VEVIFITSFLGCFGYQDYIKTIAATGASGIIFLQTSRPTNYMNRWSCSPYKFTHYRLLVVEAYYEASEHKSVIDYAKSHLESLNMTVTITAGIDRDFIESVLRSMSILLPPKFRRQHINTTFEIQIINFLL
jgi:hypothetical protein